MSSFALYKMVRVYVMIIAHHLKEKEKFVVKAFLKRYM